MLPSKFTELESKLHNWRRFYKVTQKLEHTAYYTPPRQGNIINDEIIANLEPEVQKAVLESIKKQREQINKLPPNMQEAVKLELAWRNLEDQGKKWWIKYEYIDQVSKANNGCFVMWRKMKNYGVRIRTYEQHEAFNLRALEYFQRNL